MSYKFVFDLSITNLDVVDELLDGTKRNGTIDLHPNGWTSVSGAKFAFSSTSRNVFLRRRSRADGVDVSIIFFGMAVRDAYVVIAMFLKCSHDSNASVISGFTTGPSRMSELS